MYWPEELPKGRTPYHGKNELVMSNHMEILDAMTVDERASVAHWEELDEHDDRGPQKELFWRQTFNYRTGQISVGNQAPS